VVESHFNILHSVDMKYSNLQTIGTYYISNVPVKDFVMKNEKNALSF